MLLDVCSIWFQLKYVELPLPVKYVPGVLDLVLNVLPVGFL